MEKGKKRSAKRIILTVVLSVMCCLLVLALGAVIYFEWVWSQFYRKADNFESLSQEEIEQILDAEPIGTRPPDMDLINPDDILWEEPEKLDPKEYILNILLLGQDRRPNEPRARTDTMILVTINSKDGTVTLTSFMRDTFVQIPGYYSNRLNVPYVFGGVELLYDTLELNFGIRPDHYVEVDFEGFEKIIDMVGGVDMYVSAGEAQFMNEFGFWGLKEGQHHLTGAQALLYARNRSTGGNGDFGRTERQRKVIAALIRQASTLDLLELNTMLLSCADVVQTDITAQEMVSFAVKYYPLLTNLDDVENVRIPYGDYFYSSWVEDVGAVIVPNLEKNSAVIAEYQK